MGLSLCVDHQNLRTDLVPHKSYIVHVALRKLLQVLVGHGHLVVPSPLADPLLKSGNRRAEENDQIGASDIFDQSLEDLLINGHLIIIDVIEGLHGPGEDKTVLINASVEDCGFPLIAVVQLVPVPLAEEVQLELEGVFIVLIGAELRFLAFVVVLI